MWHVDIDEVEAKIIAIQIAYENASEKVEIESDSSLKQNTIKRIMVHHTVVQWDLDTLHEAISRSHKKRWERGVDPHQIKLEDAVTPSGSYMMYHRLIDTNGVSTGDRAFDQIGWWAKHNNETFHIALIGNFEHSEPTQAQYDRLNEMIEYIRGQYWYDIPVIWHGQGEWEATACPGKFFDYDKIIPIKEPTIDVSSAKSEQLLGTFLLSRYYSCTPDQTKYLAREINTNQDNYAACNRRQFAGDNDNTMPKDGVRYTNEDAGKAIACPPELYGKTLIIENRWEVRCRDVGWAIKWKRLDIYAGIGDWAVENFDKFPAGHRKVWLK